MTNADAFERTQAYLLSTIDETQSPRTSYKLDRMQAFLAQLGDPHRAYPTIHVGGTSGKGSTATMIASALQAGGKRTGLHTKPHLHLPTERACVDSAAVSKERFAELFDEMLPAIERVSETHSRPTYYETLLALAFLHFARECVDVAVVEVGLGGRLDGTNVIVPRVAVITSVGYDHTEVLGPTLASIAFEKAGIAKRGVPLVVGDLPPEALAVVEEQAGAAGAALVQAAESARIGSWTADGETQAFDVTTPRARYGLHLAARGAFQRRNAAVAIAALERLGDDLRPDARAIERGLNCARMPGRMEIVLGEPVTVFDIAHNAEKAAALVASLNECFPNRRFQFVVAIGESKDALEIIRALSALPCSFVCTSFGVPGRAAMRPNRLAAIAQSLTIVSQTIEDPRAALEAARVQAGRDDVVVVTGSTFVVAALREWHATAAG